jgi:hypothetical protein
MSHVSPSLLHYVQLPSTPPMHYNAVHEYPILYPPCIISDHDVALAF